MVTKIAGSTALALGVLETLAPGVAQGWTGDVSDAEGLPLWLLGLLVSLMLFRVRTVFSRRRK